MGKEVFLLFLLLITIIPFASAALTPITIKTFSNDDVMVSALKPGSVYDLIESFHGTSSVDGVFSINLNTDNVDKIDIKVWVKKDNQVVVTQRFDGYDVGSPINLDVYPEGYQKPSPVVNTTIEENTTSNVTNATITENTTQAASDTQPTPNSALTGAAVKEGTSSGKTLYYIIGGIILLGILGFASAMVIRRRGESTPKEIKIRKLSEIQRERQEMKGKSAEEYKRAYESAEKKLEDSQKEISKLKNQEKIKQIEDKISKERDEVNRLRRGY